MDFLLGNPFSSPVGQRIGESPKPRPALPQGSAPGLSSLGAPEVPSHTPAGGREGNEAGASLADLAPPGLPPILIDKIRGPLGSLGL